MDWGIPRQGHDRSPQKFRITENPLYLILAIFVAASGASRLRGPVESSLLLF
jgi:hypothetical protein